MVEIEGASTEQRELLEELLARMPGTRIEALRIEPCDLVSWEELASLGIARGDPRYTKPIGVALVVTEPKVPGVREELEAELLACAFRDGAEERGWPRVLMVANRSGGQALAEPAPASGVRSALDVSGLERAVRSAAEVADAAVVSLEIFHVGGDALATALEIDEAHSFMRYRLRPFLQALDPWLQRLAGHFVEVRDGGPVPVWSGAPGRWSTRGDVNCCDPLYRQTLTGPARPLCTILGAA